MHTTIDYADDITSMRTRTPVRCNECQAAPCQLVRGYTATAVERLAAHLLRRGDRADLLQQGQHIKVEP